MSIQSAGVRRAERRTLHITVKQRLVMLALEHPNVLKGYLKIRQSSMDAYRLIRGTAVDVKRVSKQLEQIGDTESF